MSKSVSHLLNEAKEQSIVLCDTLLSKAETRYNNRLNVLQRDYIEECEEIKSTFGFYVQASETVNRTTLSSSGDNDNVHQES